MELEEYKIYFREPETKLTLFLFYLNADTLSSFCLKVPTRECILQGAGEERCVPASYEDEFPAQRHVWQDCTGL